MGFLSKLFGGDKKPAESSTPKPAPAKSGSDRSWASESGVPQELAAREVEALLASGQPPVLLDVRDDHEIEESGRIPGSVHIPMHEIQGRQTELEPDQHVVVYCASGMRSMEVGAFLLQVGFRQVSNLNGGFNAWTGAREKVAKA